MRHRAVGRAALFLSGGALLFLLAGSPAAGQTGPIRIELDDLLETDAAHAGSRVRAALQVRLQPGYHVNSDQPLDDFLIPTALTLDPPEGFSIGGFAYPDASLLSQIGVDGPLAVFEETFVVGVAFDVSEDLEPGSYVVPGTFRYQACDERMCYRPASADVAFHVDIVPADRALTPLSGDVFSGMTFTAEDQAAARAVPVPRAFAS